MLIDAFNHCWDSWRILYLFPPTPMISRALAKLRQSVFDRAIFVGPLLTGRPWYPGLSSMARNRSTLRLQQLVQDSLVVQTVPTQLFAFRMSGTTSPVGSRITVISRATSPSFSPLFRQGFPEPLAWGHHFTVPVYTETCDYILLTSSATIKRQQLHCMRTILLIVLGHFYGYGVFIL